MPGKKVAETGWWYVGKAKTMNAGLGLLDYGFA